MQYAVVIEKAEGNFSAYVPDLPGCIATGDTVEEVRAEIRNAIVFHIDGLQGKGARLNYILCRPPKLIEPGPLFPYSYLFPTNWAGL